MDINEQHLDKVMIERIVEKGYTHVLLDIDNTLVLWKESTLTEPALKMIDQMKAAGLTMCLVSNGKSQRAKEMAEALGIYYVSKAYKPLKIGIKRALRLMNATVDKTIMIGDQLLTDAWGAKRMGMDYILVDPISYEESAFTKFNRIIERIFFQRDNINKKMG